MHIPDGYLSPGTCAVLYAGAAPFWMVALRRLRAALHARLMPLLSLVSAFSFVVMMFNLPVWGGTTAHAVGMGIASVLLGPWASIVAISVALMIQAIFFGDGGITAYGANCFNMAIVGSLVAYGAYRALAGRAPLRSPRRALACGLAGYAGINASALCAAIEFGIQPGLFHDASGTPLYAPYPLGVAIPAMMAAHLSLAGVAECVLGAALVAYLQKANPALLSRTAPGALAEGDSAPTGLVRLRPLWTGLAILMLLTPLGLLAAGDAWGEWDASAFKDDAKRAEIAAASGHMQPPAHPPAGLEKLASVWTAPMPDYAPPFLKSAQLGYICSAMFGTGLILAACLLIDWLVGWTTRHRQPAA